MIQYGVLKSMEHIDNEILFHTIYQIQYFSVYKQDQWTQQTNTQKVDDKSQNNQSLYEPMS